MPQHKSLLVLGIICALFQFAAKPAAALLVEPPFEPDTGGWWFQQAFSVSSLCALLAAFKLGTEGRLRIL